MCWVIHFTWFQLSGSICNEFMTLHEHILIHSWVHQNIGVNNSARMFRPILLSMLSGFFSVMRGMLERTHGMLTTEPCSPGGQALLRARTKDFLPSARARPGPTISVRRQDHTQLEAFPAR